MHNYTIQAAKHIIFSNYKLNVYPHVTQISNMWGKYLIANTELSLVSYQKRDHVDFQIHAGALAYMAIPFHHIL